MQRQIVTLILSIAGLAAQGHADPGAILVDAELRNDPQVARMIREYEKIAAANPICNDKKLFGLRTVTVDGQKRVRFFVDGAGADCVPSRMQPSEAWRIQRTDWKDSDETAFAEFVSSIGNAVAEGKCRSVDSCLISSANNLKEPNDDSAFHYADCADFPYYMRAYFAFRSGLPFSFASRMWSRTLTKEDQQKAIEIDAKITELTLKQNMGQLTKDDGIALERLQKARKLRNDPRYTPNGNWVAQRQWIIDDGKVDFFGATRVFRDLISTATLRVWRNQGEKATSRNLGELTENEPDFYSPRLDSNGIQPGTVVYKTDGHTALIYKIDRKTGQVFYIDAHPDNSISHGILDDTWMDSFSHRANYGGGFKNFRPLVYRNGFWPFVQPSIRMMTDEELGDHFSMEQYERFTKPGTIVNISVAGGLKGKVGYSDFIRLRLSGGKYRIDPMVQLKSDAQALCKNIQSRRSDVLAATERGMHLEPHPAQLPDNIYGAQGDWEKYSTPGRDVTFRSRVVNISSSLRKYRDMIKEKHFLMKPGTTLESLKAEAAKTWNEIASACTISYRNSAGKDVSFNLTEAIKRSPYMSFDPYLCPERRFGAQDANELASCTDTLDKADWHARTQFLRNKMIKNNLEPMGWSLSQLLTIENAAQVDSQMVEKLDVLKSIEGL